MILYKYLTEERVDVLENSKIRFTQPIYLNDEYEALPIFKQILTTDGFDTHLKNKIGQTSDYYTKELIKEALPFLNNEQINKILENPNVNALVSESFNTLVDQFKNVLTTEIFSANSDASKHFKDSASKKFGILSLSEVFDSQTMWAHYANQNKGFIIGFNTSNPFFNQRIAESDEIRFVRPVSYSPERPIWPTLDSETTEKDFKNSMINSLLTKNIDWSYEREWRMIMPLERANSIISTDIHLFNYPPESITKIIFGLNTNDATKEKLINIVRRNLDFTKIKISQSTISNNYSIKLVDLP